MMRRRASGPEARGAARLVLAAQVLVGRDRDSRSAPSRNGPGWRTPRTGRARSRRSWPPARWADPPPQALRRGRSDDSRPPPPWPSPRGEALGLHERGHDADAHAAHALGEVRREVGPDVLARAVERVAPGRWRCMPAPRPPPSGRTAPPDRASCRRPPRRIGSPRRTVGFTATVPQKLPGWRMEPPVSEPSATVASPRPPPPRCRPTSRRARARGPRGFCSGRTRSSPWRSRTRTRHVELAERDAAGLDGARDARGRVGRHVVGEHGRRGTWCACPRGSCCP